MDLVMLIRGSKRSCASTQGRDAQDCLSSSINPSGPTFAMENPDMEGSLWSRLPEDLLERVLARLPAANLLRLRIVCRKWSEIMASKCFLEACSQVASYEPYFVKIFNCERNFSLWSFNPCKHRWRNVPVRYLPAEVDTPVSSSGGLICFISKRQSAGLVLFVTNPLTKTWKELPEFLCELWPMWPMIRMIMWKRPSHYKVIVAGNGNMGIFDSVESEWRNIRSQPPSVPDVSLNVAFLNGRMYCLTPPRSNLDLLAFSIQDEVWSKVKTDPLPENCEFRNLVTYKGHIVIVGKSVRQQVLSVCVWLLEWKSMKWREAGRMPKDMSDRFLRSPCSQFRCCSHGDMIFLTSIRCNTSLLFDLAKNMWHRVEAWHLLDAFSFEPRLDSQV